MSIVDDTRAVASQPPGEAHALPFGAYSSQDIYELEQQRIFRRDWIAVCAAAALPDAGDYLAIEIAGEPVVVVRGADGELRALSNVCRHRGTILVEGFGNQPKFTCPYHAWAFSDTGRFLGAPYTGDVQIDPDAHCLPQFRLETWAGIAFVALDPDVEPLAHRMAGAERFLRRFGLDRLTASSPLAEPQRWKANWKLAYENGIESYHLFRVHAKTLELYSPTRAAFYLEGGASWALTAGPLAGDTKERPGDPPEMTDFERSNYVLVSLPPSLVGIVSRDSWGWISILPTAPDECLIHIGGVGPESAGRGDAVANEFAQTFLEEDRLICERNQRAMRAQSTSGGRLVELERVVVDFHQYLASRLFDHEPEKHWSAPEAARF